LRFFDTLASIAHSTLLAARFVIARTHPSILAATPFGNRMALARLQFDDID
jgi:hypothetical protein